MPADLISSALAVIAVAMLAFAVSATAGLILDRWALRRPRGSLAGGSRSRRRGPVRSWIAGPGTPES
jgi:hypothetical protein